MHKPQTTSRPSVFYDYKVYPFSRPSGLGGIGEAHKVTIIGAGPIGLLLALQLAQHGVGSVIVESEAQVSFGSRAIVLTRRSMEILQQAGVDQAFVEKGLQWQFGRSFYKGNEVYKMVMPYDENDRFLPGLNIQQQYIEQFLIEAADESPLIDIRWQTKFISLTQSDDRVTLKLDTPEGEYELRTNWCVASDGGRSAVRKHMGLRLEGNAYPGNFVIADILAPIDLPTERLCFFEPDWNPGNNVLVHRQPEGLWRLDFRLPENETAEQALEGNLLNQRINKILDMIGQKVEWELDWATVYSANALTLPDYRHGQVLFCGDAAHILPIFGVRGANTGFQDAQNLAWKLAATVLNDTGVELVDTYSHERVLAAKEICEEAGKSTRFMSPPSVGYRTMRDAALSFSLSEEFAKDFMHWRTSRPHDYYDSPINAVADDNKLFTGGIANGEPCPNVKMGEDDYLLDYMGASFHILAFVDDGYDGSLKDIMAMRSVAGMAIATIAIGGDCAEALVNLPDKDGVLAERFDAKDGGIYLIRPDQHTCGRWKNIQKDKLLATIKSSLNIRDEHLKEIVK